MNASRDTESETSLQALPLVLKALHFAADKHRRQRRKDAGASPYINHPIAVAEVLCTIGVVRDPFTIVAGILHDTIEDTETTGEEIEIHFGAEVRRIVEQVTDDKALPSDVRKRLQIETAASHCVRARLVKLADKICNVRDIIESPPVGWSAERRQEYVAWAQAVVNQLRGTNAALERCFDELYQRAVTRVGGESAT